MIGNSIGSGGVEHDLLEQGEEGHAIYSGKEEWKNEGNRYTAEELREMEQNWNVEIFNPYRPHCCSAD